MSSRDAAWLVDSVAHLLYGNWSIHPLEVVELCFQHRCRSLVFTMPQILQSPHTMPVEAGHLMLRFGIRNFGPLDVF